MAVYVNFLIKVYFPKKKCVVCLGYLIDCEHLKLVGWCGYLVAGGKFTPFLYVFLVVGLETIICPVSLK
jgi:hypothetical protein